MALPTGAPVYISLGGQQSKKSGGGAVLLLLLLLLVVLVVTPFAVFMTKPCWLHDKAPKVFDTLKDAAIKMKLRDEGYSIDEEDCDAQE
jgi:hypothetical protein